MRTKGVIQLLIESRLSDAIDKYANQLVELGKMSYDNAVGEITSMAEADPSSNNKYLDWIVNQSIKLNNSTYQSNHIVDDIIDAVREFHENLDKISPELIDQIKSDNVQLSKNQQTIDKIRTAPKNIDSYDTLNELKLVINYAKHNLSRKQKRDVAKEEAEKLYEDGEILIVRPKSYRASCYYGAGSKWCVTMKRTQSYWNDYTANGELIFILDKQNPRDKVAVYLTHAGGVGIYDSADKPIPLKDAFKLQYGNGKQFIPIKAKEIIMGILFNDVVGHFFPLLSLLGPEQLLKELLDRNVDIYNTFGDRADPLVLEGYPILFPEDGYKRLFDYYETNGIPPVVKMQYAYIEQAFNQDGKGLQEIFNYYNEANKSTAHDYSALNIMPHEDLLKLFGGDKQFINYVLKDDQHSLDTWYSATELLDIFDGDFDQFINFLEENDLTYYLDDMTEFEQYKIFIDLYRNAEDQEKKSFYWSKLKEIIPDGDVTINDDGSVTLVVGSWSDFVDLFASGGRDIDYHYVAEQVLGEEGMDWEPFSGIVQDWYDEVWDGATDDENIKYIRGLINDKLAAGEDIEVWVENWGDTDDYSEWIEEDGEDGMFHLTIARLQEITDADLGRIIENEDEFYEWKNEMRWAYESSYNQAAQENYWKAYHKAILDVIGTSGKGDWVYTGRYKTYGKENQFKSEILELHFPNIDYWEVVDAYVECDGGYYDNDYLQYSSFLGVLGYIMDECDYNGGLLSPNVYEWPDTDDVKKYYNEYLQERI